MELSPVTVAYTVVFAGLVAVRMVTMCKNDAKKADNLKTY